jgi:hypothetical protein
MSVKHLLWIGASLMLAACDSTSGPNVDGVPDNRSGPQVPALPVETTPSCQVSSQPVSSHLSSAKAKPCPNQPQRPVL